MFLYKLKFKTLLCFTRERSSCDRVQQSYIIFFLNFPSKSRTIVHHEDTWSHFTQTLMQ